MKAALPLFLLCLTAWLLAGCAPSDQRESSGGTQDGGVSAHGQLSVTDGRLTDRNGETFQLRGFSTHGINWYPEYLNAGAMRFIREAGGNLIRAAMYTDAEGGYLEDPETNTARVIGAIENARAEDLYILVDWHILSDGDPNDHLTQAITFFDRIASAYPDDPAVLYEVCNEPNGVGWEAIRTYAFAIVPVIRQYSPHAVIVLGTPSFSSDLSGPAVSPFPEENILYAYHYYAGEHGSFTALKNAVEKKLPVMVSEWGIGKDASGSAALQAGKAFAEYLNSEAVSWCAWSLCGKDEVYSILRPECTALSRWQKEDLTEVGLLLTEALRGGAR